MPDSPHHSSQKEPPAAGRRAQARTTSRGQGSTPSKPPRNVVLRWFLVVIFASTLIAGACFAWFNHALRAPLVISPGTGELLIPPGSNARQIAQLVAQSGVQVPPWLFEWGARYAGLAPKLQAGSYALTEPLTLERLIQRLARGDVSQAELLVVEGWTFAQTLKALHRHPDVQTTLPTDPLEAWEQLRRNLNGGIPSAIKELDEKAWLHPEGWLAPNTYSFPKRASDAEILKRMLNAQIRRLQEVWALRDPQSAFATPYELLTAASIIEKETGRGPDRPLVAAVLSNRLKIGMPLQVDPSVIYGLGASFDGNLRKRDLRADTPYNTYLHRGLTPTPIALPGKAALLAAAQPAPGRYLYFVARGDGSSEFSETLTAHERAVDRYQRAASASAVKP